MASTTTNLGLTKPAYSDDADISDINGNMDLIDAEAGKVRANVAANYDSSETYAVGDYCLHDGSLYKCTTAISSPESWTAGHWTQIKIAGELSSLSDQIGNIGKSLTNGSCSGYALYVLTLYENTIAGSYHTVIYEASRASEQYLWVPYSFDNSVSRLLKATVSFSNGTFTAEGYRAGGNTSADISTETTIIISSIRGLI